ncbi:MAG: 1,4-dihydroxy-2-naphthoate polyprenyltransferase [Pasteurellaceae bacterium]|nr:1,4-dihydroxy-2-naphthoate polyprenyltransferase [Pasteurellaceae bacterium]
MQHFLKIWLSTARPKTLPLALAIILTASTLAYWFGQFSLPITLLCLLTTTLLQIVSNFANDYGDHQKGSDTAERIGPLRGIQKGQMSATQLRNGLIVMVIASLLSGSVLISVAYQSTTDLIAFAVLGILAILSAITYTVGAKPYGYLGLGDLSVFLFFGLLAVCGTFYLQTHSLQCLIFLPAAACGLLSTAVLNINNLRDIEQDRKAGKNTLVVRIGAKKGRIYHCLLLALASLCYFVFVTIDFRHWSNFLFVLALPLLIKHALFVYRSQNPMQLRPMLAQMSILALLTNILFSLGLLIGN